MASTIIGATRPEPLVDTLKAKDVTLPFPVLAKIDELTRDILYPMG